MRVVFFCHSLLSDWNHGNAHFLRGVVTELSSRGNDVRVFEPRDAWSVENLVRDHGEAALDAARAVYPQVTPVRYDAGTLDLDAALDAADLVVVHEWSERDLVARLGARRAAGGRFRLLFHDTHHRAVTDPASMKRYDLSGYDGVLAFGEVLRQLYVARGWARRSWTWHEAADTRVFRPRPALARAEGDRAPRGDVVWIGNWGDGERTAELHEMLLAPVRDERLSATVHGVRYPEEALVALREAGIAYGGYLPNHLAPQVFARFGATVHVPRRPYVEALPGIPTIRVFEALACGIPLVSAPWDDAEGLFQPGEDFLVARDGAAMRAHLRALKHDRALARGLAEHGLRTIARRHTCAHRVDELLAIARELGVDVSPPAPASSASPAPLEQQGAPS